MSLTRLRRPFLLCLFATGLCTCAPGADEGTEGGPSSEPGLRACTDPRPEMCTQQYVPVCARLSGGGSKTYSNACSACTDPSVEGSVPGRCEG